ncbi:hypothetical protein AB1N83_008983, partial [Pleurotus pulmonarius]
PILGHHIPNLLAAITAAAGNALRQGEGVHGGCLHEAS